MPFFIQKFLFFFHSREKANTIMTFLLSEKHKKAFRSLRIIFFEIDPENFFFRYFCAAFFAAFIFLALFLLAFSLKHAHSTKSKRVYWKTEQNIIFYQYKRLINPFYPSNCSDFLYLIENKKMNLYRSLLISTLLFILVVTTIQQQQACSEGGAFV